MSKVLLLSLAKLRRHFRLLEAAGIAVISLAAMLEVVSIRSYDHQTGQLSQVFRSFNEANETRLRLYNLSREVHSIQVRLSRAWEPEDSHLSRELLYEIEETDLLIERAQNVAKTRAVMGLPERDSKEHLTTVLAETRERARTMIPNLNLATWQQVQVGLLALRSFNNIVHKTLYLTEAKTLSELTWLRHRLQKVHLALFCLGTTCLIFGKIGNWLKERDSA